MASSLSPASAEGEEASLWQRWKRDGDVSARQDLFHRHAALAQSIARRTHRSRSHSDLDLADLIQQANGALLETIDRYDPSRGVPFSAYASHRVGGSLSDAISQSSDIRAQYSARVRNRRDRIRSLSDKLGEDLSTGDALDALADLALGLGLGFMLEDGGQTDGTPDQPGFNAYQSVAWQELLTRLTEELDTLRPRERSILRDHYLHGVAFETLASLMGVSKGRISQLHHAALLTLRKRLALRGHFSLQQ